MKRSLAISCLLSTFVAASLHADVALNGMFTDHAVLQQNMRIPVWGTASVGEKVTVKLGNNSISTTSKDGTWIVRMPAMKAGGPYTLGVTGNNHIEYKDILIGEVWICSGQSNMQMGLGACLNADSVIANSKDEELRLYTVPLSAKLEAEKDLKSAWLGCAPDTVGGFSAVGYYFGRYLRQTLKVPVGLINSSWGGTIVQAWTSQRVIDTEKSIIDIDPNLPKSLPHIPACLYNGMISPVIPYGIKGAIWYQGESNAAFAYYYRFLHANMIKNWREDWGQGDFPFLSVQLAPFLKAADPEQVTDGTWAELRESQVWVADKVKKSDLAIITDVGDATDIHPKDKQPVGERLAYLALHNYYGKKNVACYGPQYKSITIKDNTAVVKFAHTEGGLVCKGEKLTGFAVAGEDKVFHWADAKIAGNTVVLSSSAVAHPVAVRYGWRFFPELNLFNGNNLPASPFRTDAWKLKTQP